MFRFFFTYDLIFELDKELKRDHKIVQLMVDEYDLFLLSKSLLSGIEKNMVVEIVIISTSNKKSMKLVNLCKRLIDLDVEIYWKLDKTLFVKEDYFAIFDKEYLISKREQPEFESFESLVKIKNEFFNGLTLASKKLTLFDGEIDIQFDVDKSIIYPNEEVFLEWNVKNAHQIEIEPLQDKLDFSGKKSFLLKEDTKFTLVAKNNGSLQKKSIFIRVLKAKEIEFDVEVYDPLIKEYILLKPISAGQGNYAVYLGQKVKISWNIKMMGKLIESNLGNLPLSGFEEFETHKNTEFHFTFKSLNFTDKKSIFLHCFENNEIFSKSEETQATEIIQETSISLHKKILHLIINFFTKLLFKK